MPRVVNRDWDLSKWFVGLGVSGLLVAWAFSSNAVGDREYLLGGYLTAAGSLLLIGAGVFFAPPIQTWISLARGRGLFPWQRGLAAMGFFLVGMGSCAGGFKVRIDRMSYLDSQTKLAQARKEAELTPVQRAEKVKQDRAQAAQREAEAKRLAVATPPQPTAPPVPRISSFDAWYFSTEKVRSQLKAPSAAKFPTFDESFVMRRKPNEFIVNGFVDAPNGFGVMIRNTFACSIVFPTEKTYDAGCVVK